MLARDGELRLIPLTGEGKKKGGIFWLGFKLNKEKDMSKMSCFSSLEPFTGMCEMCVCLLMLFLLLHIIHISPHSPHTRLKVCTHISPLSLNERQYQAPFAIGESLLDCNIDTEECKNIIKYKIMEKKIEDR